MDLSVLESQLVPPTVSLRLINNLFLQAGGDGTRGPLHPPGGHGLRQVLSESRPGGHPSRTDLRPPGVRTEGEAEMIFLYFNNN